ncbi:helix-hairpin-helix domain-containing protein [Cellulosimicrobium marinum]|uniref:helix-hairpin-helix domain-containing protein n=1 Tax=Cellulosimicrobium marinum TaxID=1638992 RepID=UPI001E50FBD8|nr:helix-hairpin-helix domain-containing protein [Cellulosimicrobium marinum]MCB7136044.1 hypothetical protein [Cellulosimicrobium marinum]
MSRDDRDHAREALSHQGDAEGPRRVVESTAGVAPVVGLPSGIGRPATRALVAAGLTSLSDVARLTDADLLALHGVGPKAVRILREALAAR